jgi:hypothetical protein
VSVPVPFTEGWERPPFFSEEVWEMLPFFAKDLWARLPWSAKEMCCRIGAKTVKEFERGRGR